jgi:hypothetical protein
VIDYAARNREHLLYNIYAMGRRAIERGSQDTWTPSPTRLRMVAEKMGGGGGRGGTPERDAALWAEVRKPEHRDPRGYIIPSNQPDFLTAIKFINALREVNVTVQRATTEFGVAGRTYPAGSFVVMTAQAFRPHVLDMFEPQDHPNVIPYPGAPPTPPYDNAGWTLAYQMGVAFDRVLEPFSGPFERVTDWNVAPPPGRITAVQGAGVYQIDRRANDAYRAVNRLLAQGARVTATQDAFYVGASAQTTAQLQKIAADLGVSAQGLASAPAAPQAVHQPRIGLWDQYGGSIESGWTRWILEQFEFPFERVFAQKLDAGNLHASYDVLIFPNGAIPAASGAGRGGRGGGPSPNDALMDIPQEYRSQLGRVSVDRTVPQLRQFIEAGGTVIAIGDAAVNLAAALTLPVEDHLTENGAPLTRAKYFVPGSILSGKVDVTQPIAAGMNARTDFFFDNSPVFRLGSGATAAGVRAIASFDSPSPLRSGWAWGQKSLEGGIIAIDAPLGKGRVLLFGPEILQRAQPHGTFKLLFNGIMGGAVR